MLKYVQGNVVTHKPSTLRILPHIVNNSGAWGSGVVVSIEKQWKGTRAKYLDWYNANSWNCDFTLADIPFQLGQVQFIQVDDDTIIANMASQGQPGGETINGIHLKPIRLDCLRECMLRVAEVAKQEKAIIEAPKFGSLRAGASWNDDIEPLVKELWYDLDVTVFVFDEK